MRIGIVGWGVEGQSAYRYFGPEHDYLIVSEEPRDDFPQESDKIKIQSLEDKKPPGIASSAIDLSYLEGIDKCDKIIYSPTSIKNLEKTFGSDNKKFWEKAATVQHVFFENVKTKNLIGVTGSKGKGTTSSLIYEMLKAAGKPVHIAGNIGTGALDILGDVEMEDWVVLELTNYQLYKFSYSPHIAVCLMITKEHLDWHVDIDEYISAKTNLFSHQSKDDIAVYLAGDELSEQVAGSSPGIKIPYFDAPGARVREDGMIVIGEETEVMPKTEVKLIGKHNLQNICAALTTVFEALGSLDKAKTVLSSFSGLEHRLELVRELEGVKYYDDSFGTNPDTAIVAMEALVQPIILIVGGYDRGIPMDPLVKEITKDRVKHVIAIGQTGSEIVTLLKKKSYEDVTTGLNTMDDIVEAAKGIAEPGDVVLLSPAAASFDMFKNFEVRGDKFKESVNRL